MKIAHEIITDYSDDPYMERWIIGRLRIHKFLRGDVDPDPHTHPFDFITFPLTSSYAELVRHDNGEYHVNVVKRWRFHRRLSSHCHRVLGPIWCLGENGNVIMRHRMVFWTIVWTSRKKRAWFFIKPDGTPVHWLDYIRQRGTKVK